MKKLLLVIAMLPSINAKAQTLVYHPFPDSNIVWIQTYWWTDFTPFPPCIITDDHDLFIAGDTTIGTFTYHKLYANGFMHATCPPPGYNYYGDYRGAFRQDTLNKKVFMFSYGNDSLAYDFNLNVGDTLPISCLQGSETNYVQSIDSVLIGTQYHKRFWLSSLIQTAPDYATLIEGIGTSLGAFPVMLPAFESGNDLYCVKINNQTVWTNPLFPGFQCSLLSVSEHTQVQNNISISPNPFSHKLNFSINNNEISEVIIYDIASRKLLQQKLTNSISLNTEQLEKGIYLYEVRTKSGSCKKGKVVKD